LDLVIAHAHEDNYVEMLALWADWLSLPNIREMQPYIFLYCKAGNHRIPRELHPLAKRGEVHHLENIGREQHTYLHHIVTQWHDLARHTVFTQSVPVHVGGALTVPIIKDIVPKIPFFRHLDRPKRFLRRSRMLKSDTGLLALDAVEYSSCDGTRKLSLPQVKQVWQLVMGTPCDDGYAAFLKGEIAVSAARLQQQNLSVYQTLLELIAKPTFDFPGTPASMQTRSNPIFGHAMERSWNFLLGCYNTSLVTTCNACDRGLHECAHDACQCLDH
jgi:hypothetical protein